MTITAARQKRNTPAMEEDSALELVRNLGEIIQEETGLRGEINSKLADALVSGLRKRYGTEQIYIPSARTLTIGSRNAEIREQWNGRNLAELAERFHLDPRQIRRITAPSEK